jgi:hypothetical protein
MTPCDRSQAYVEKFLGGEATAEEVAAFEGHAATCSPCREAFQAASTFDTAMKASVPHWTAGLSNPREAVLQKIEMGRLMGRTSTPYPAVRWRAVRWTLFIGFLAFLAIQFQALATFAVQREVARKTQAQQQARAYSHFLHRYQAETGALPESGNTRMALALMREFRHPQLHTFPFDAAEIVDEQVLDPWRRPWVYRSDGRSFTFYSLGENGRDDQGEGDDVVWRGSWKGRDG